MDNHVEKLLPEQMNLGTGFAYAVPLKWWKQFCEINSQAQKIEQLYFPELNLQLYTDSFLFEYLPYIIEQLQHKCNYLKFNRVFMSPTPKTSIEWKVVSCEFWRFFSQKNHKNQGIMLYYDPENPYKWLTEEKSQLQIVFCSKNGSQVFIGYFPDNLKIIDVIRAVGFDLGFIEMEESRIMYPDKSHGQIYYFPELQNQIIKTALDTLVMAFNLEKQEDKGNELQRKLDQNINSSNEAVMGDLGMVTNQSWDNILNNRTMSTGAETPSFLWSDDDHGEFRVKELFRERKPEQIEQMKQYAEKCIKGELILLPVEQEQMMEKHLQVVAAQIIEYAGMYKKKIPKDKQLFIE